MNRRIIALALGETLVVVGGLWAIGHHGVAWDARPGYFVAYASAFAALALLPPLYVELKRHACWLTLTEAGLLLGLFVLGPLAFLAAATLAEVVPTLKHRQSLGKWLFNAVHLLGGFVAAALTFTLLGQTDPLSPLAWLAGIAALTACVAWDVISTASVLALSENQQFRKVACQLLPAAFINLATASLLGIAALVLSEQTPFGPLLFVPVLGLLVVSTRGVAQQRAERLRFQQLYEASSSLARLTSLSETLGTIAIEGKGLMTGAAAICCTSRPDGTWIGVLVDDAGTREASEVELKALTTLAATGHHGECDPQHLPREVRKPLPPFASMVWAAKRAEPSGTVLLAVFRELSSDEQGEHRSDILTAFVAHAATVVDNVGLHEDVQEALERQVALNQQKSDFVAAVSHELRTPLTAMMGSVQTMKRLGERMPLEKRNTLLDMGLAQGIRLQHLIDDLLLVAAADHHTVKSVCQPVSIAAMFSELDTELRGSIGDRLRFLPPPEDVGTVETDTDKLRRIVVNLVVNAGKYAPEGPIEIAARRGGRSISITVADHGPGIPPEDRERVFERFVQLDQSATRRQGGTGLGLHLCRQLAEVLGGRLSVDEAPGGGARFTLVLTDAVAVAEAGAISTPPTGVTAAPRTLPAGMARSPMKARPDASAPAPAPLDKPAPAPAAQPTPRTLPAGMARSPLKRPASLAQSAPLASVAPSQATSAAITTGPTS